MNEVYVQGLEKAMTAKKNSKNIVDVRYVGNMYMRGHIFKVEGTKFEGSSNEIIEAGARAGVKLNHLTSKPDPVVERAEKKIAAARKASTPR